MLGIPAQITFERGEKPTELNNNNDGKVESKHHLCLRERKSTRHPSRLRQRVKSSTASRQNDKAPLLTEKNYISSTSTGKMKVWRPQTRIVRQAGMIGYMIGYKSPTRAIIFARKTTKQRIRAITAITPRVDSSASSDQSNTAKRPETGMERAIKLRGRQRCDSSASSDKNCPRAIKLEGTSGTRKATQLERKKGNLNI